ncbi:hypothetical protein CO046_03255 [Candidatus Peregrinibacteria bacterium CG_4_9_14_0_2_um_filter_53_11]|nr:MAG: hypothetical protein CO046_03255 [Candidatus Peregrinibacteria bacterium CG_4_9_14_0_2_um_filter_53_11]
MKLLKVATSVFFSFLLVAESLLPALAQTTVSEPPLTQVELPAVEAPPAEPVVEEETPAPAKEDAAPVAEEPVEPAEAPVELVEEPVEPAPVVELPVEPVAPVVQDDSEELPLAEPIAESAVEEALANPDGPYSPEVLDDSGEQLYYGPFPEEEDATPLTEPEVEADTEVKADPEATINPQETKIYPYYKLDDYTKDSPEFIADHLQVVDQMTDVVDLGNGEYEYRLFSEPRLLYKDGEKLMVREAGWNLFNELQGTQFNEAVDEGYFFSVPLEDGEAITIMPGAYEEGATNWPVLKPQFSQRDEDTATVTTLENVYKGIDVQFADKGAYRERKIILNSLPTNLKEGEDAVFWEQYKLPAGSLLIDSNGKPLEAGRTEMEKTTLNVKTPSGSLFRITDALVYDKSAGTTPEELELSDQVFPVKQIVDIDYTQSVVRIGLKLSADYLLSKERQYPVTIDPEYYFCLAGNRDLNGNGLSCQNNSFSTTDFYLRYIAGSWTESADLYMGYSSRDLATRHPIMKFNISAIPANYTINSAFLLMYLRTTLGNGSFRGSVSTVARRIDTFWQRDWDFHYNDIRGRMTDIGFRDVNTQSIGWYSWTVSNLVRDWFSGARNNYGLLVEPTPTWNSGARPAWPDKLMIFSSSRNANDNGPYLKVNTTAPALFPDLTSGGSSAVASIDQGEVYTITNTISNRGSVSTGRTGRISYYLRPSGVGEDYSGTYYVGYRTFNAINANSTTQVSFSYTIPNDLAPGNYTFYYWIDSLQQIAESNESNNKFTRALTVNARAQLSDITYANASLTDNSVYPGDSTTLSLQVRNNGQGAANDSGHVRYYISRSNPSYSDGNSIGNDSFGTLQASGSGSNTSSESISYTVPEGTASGTYYFSFWVDNLDEITNESSEGNNKSSVSFTVPETRDIYPVNLDVQNVHTFISGERLEAQARIMNSGNITAIGLPYILVLQSTSTGELYQLTSHNPASLDISAGANVLRTLSGVVPGNIPFNDSYVLVLGMNTANSLSERNYNNNAVDSDQIFTVERSGYCGNCSPGGGGGGGATPPPDPEELSDTDRDTFSDLEEKYVGTNVNGAQTVSLFQLNASNWLSTLVDKLAINYAADPVNIRTGVFEFIQTDLELKGRGIPINITRSYNSRVVDKNNRIGFGWNHSTNMYYYQDPATRNVLVYLGGTLAALFTTNDNGATFVAPKGVDGTLVNNGTPDNALLTYTTFDGVRYDFTYKRTTQLGMVEQITDLKGNVTAFTYIQRRDIPLLTTITDASGRTVSFVYGAEDDGEMFDKITEVHDNLNTQDHRLVRYGYESGFLTTVTNVRSFNGSTENLVRTFTYDNDRMATYTDARGTVLYNTYDDQGRVIRQDEKNPRLGANDQRRIYTLSYTDAPDGNVPGSTSCTTVKNFRSGDDPDFYKTYTCFDQEGLKIYEKEGDNGGATSYQYNPDGMATRVTDPNGNATLYDYDQYRRVTRQQQPFSHGWNTVTTYQYHPVVNKVSVQTKTATSLVNPATVVIRSANFVYDQSNGNLLTINYDLGGQERFSYDNRGNILRSWDKNNNVTDYTYDAAQNYRTGESITVTLPDGSTQLVQRSYVYDVFGNKTSVTNARGFVSQFQYDSHGNLKRAQDPAGNVTTYIYDSEDHLIQKNDPQGRVTTYVYDTDIEESLLSTSITGPRGETIFTSSEYDFVGNKVRDVDARDVVTSYSYDDANRVSAIAAPYNTTTFQYDRNGNKVSESNTQGQSSVFSYDGRNNLLSSKKFVDAGQTSFVETTYTYDGFDELVSTTDPKGQTTTTTYDLLGRLTSVTDTAGGLTSYTYDANGNRTGVRDARANADPALRNADGNTATYGYDEMNRLILERNSLNKETTFTYDKQNNLLQVVDRKDANGNNSAHVTTHTYDNLDRKTQTTDAKGAHVSYTYDALSNLTSRTDELGRTVSSTYDDFGRAIQQRDADQNLTVTVFDGNGNKVQVTAPDNTVTNYDYDNANRLTTVTNVSGATLDYLYDAAGNTTSESDWLNHTTTYTYDKLNRLLTESNAVETVTSYTYDNNGNRLAETTGGTVTAFSYDALNRVTQITHPGNKTEGFDYDALGNITQKTDGEGQLTTFAYDAKSRLTRKALDDGSIFNYSYDNWDQLTQLVEPVGTTSYQYDLLNLRTRETKTYTDLNGQSYAVNRTYTADGKLNTLTDAAGRLLDYNYDSRGLLDTVTFGGSALATYEYNALAQPTELTYGNGLATSYGYDSLNRLDNITLRDAQNNELFAHEYDFDAQSNRTQLVERTSVDGTDTDRTINYTYDLLDQLKTVDYTDVAGAQDLRFNYDAQGNRLSLGSALGSTSYSYANDSEELRSYTTNGRLTVAMEYDGNGSLTRESYSRLGQPLKNVSYSWDVQNRLSQIRYTDASRPNFMPQLNENSLTFAYDDAGNRIKKTVNGSDSTYYFNDGLTVLNELNTNGGVERTIVQGVGEVAEIDAQGRIIFVHSDALGSAVMLSNEAGEITQQYDYDPYGEIIGSLGSDETRYLFTGQEYDSESNLFYYNARYYNPTTGRFISRDKYMGAVGSLISRNSYAYANNNPLRYTDPTGNESEAVTEQIIEDNSSYASTPILLASSSASATSVCSICFDPTSDLIQKLKANGKEMANAYQHDLLVRAEALKEANKIPWWRPGARVGAKAAAGLLYEAERASTYIQFFNHVKPGGDWDYKIQDVKRFGSTEPVTLAGVTDNRVLFDARGNINFGYTGAAAGIPSTTLLSGAGAAQIYSRTSDTDWYASYFDDPTDQMLIKTGITLYQKYGLNIDDQKLNKALEYELGYTFISAPGYDYWKTK